MEKGEHAMDVKCTSIEDVRRHIDQIDREVVTLLGKRGKFVTQAAAFATKNHHAG